MTEEQEELVKLNSDKQFDGALKEKVDEELRSAGIGRVQQKIRICEDDKTELLLRLSLLSGLLVVVALAVFATYRLHKIADYQVWI